ncbi:XRE family transcriptional regulator [Cryobacterium glaciale]|uniref:XRE family transcriptional regulator n=1 Tax=Cryobacterium glaciale TaxID=1259145 RepID=A0A4R8UQM7_9MICO|nr:XRE family transcriptional regulator [Cryobacterium glaciale]TFB68084.1 XRE family transcriptional regulator [Cryobacterium glaciale]
MRAARAPRQADAVTLASTIGARIRRERLAREWTLDHLADAASISRRQVINLEQGEANPSIGTLLSLSDALGITLSALIEPPSSRLVKITRAGEGAQLWTGDNGGRGVLLVSTQAPDVVELWDWTLNPGERHASKPHHQGARELLRVHVGVVTLDVGDDRHELAAGDTIMFPGEVAHAYGNEGAEPAHFSLAVYDPTGPRTSAAARA